MVFLYNVFTSRRHAKQAGLREEADPWDARSLEWMVQSPVPAHNFDEVPIVTHLDEFWHRKYGEDESGRPVRIAETVDVVQKGDGEPHLPAPSYWPIVLASALPLIGYGIIFNLGFAAVGAVVMFVAIYGWSLEPSYDPEAPGHDDDHSDHAGGDDDDHGATAELPSGEDTTPSDDVPAPSEEEAPVG
jgi:cytochrome c oxidase subunit 1